MVWKYKNSMELIKKILLNLLKLLLSQIDGSEDNIFDGFYIINKLIIIKEPKTNSESDSSYDSDGENEKKNFYYFQI